MEKGVTRLARRKVVLPERATLVSMLRQMYEIRLFEEALYHAYMTENVPGTIHQSIGQEAVAVGVAQALRPDDWMTSTHRGHAHAIAKGIPLRAMMAEMYGKATGASRGMGGSMHVFDLPRGFLGSIGVVGAGAPIASGAALASKLEGKRRVVACFFGDGASNTGAVHESLNLAAVWKLPLVFVCENNRYAVSMPVSKAVAIEHISERAAAYGMPGVTIDGMDVLAVHFEAQRAVARARAGEGPTLIECETYRFKGHSKFEPATYRPDGELESWLARDPIPRFRKRLLEEKILSTEEADALRTEVENTVEDAIAFAKASPDPDPRQVVSWVYA
jgi:pyruvate dehydrogenase E1 component alpha subunit